MDDRELDILLQARHFEEASPGAKQRIIAHAKPQKNHRSIKIAASAMLCSVLLIIAMLPFNPIGESHHDKLFISDTELLENVFYYPDDTLFM